MIFPLTNHVLDITILLSPKYLFIFPATLLPAIFVTYSSFLFRFLWMVRIGGGVFPIIKEPDYLVNGEYRVDKGAAPKMLNCLM